MTAEPERKPVSAQLRVIINGYAADLTASGSLEQLVGLTQRLQELGIEPGQSPLLGKPQAERTARGNGTPRHDGPVCPHHGARMIASKKRPGQLYCPAQNDDGSYCRHTIDTQTGQLDTSDPNADYAPF